MKRNTFLVIAFGIIVALSMSSCKTKQQTTKVTGASKVAGTSATTSSTSASGASATTTGSGSGKSTSATTKYSTESEVTRNEKFELAEMDDATAKQALNKKYHVVVGSFKSKDNAKGLQSSLKSEGYNPIIVINEMGMYRVLINSYNSYSSARELINSISNRFSDAWVLVQK